MKARLVFAALSLPNAVYPWSPFTNSEHAPSIAKDIRPAAQSPSEINPSRLLESSRQTPGFYSKAMLEIKRLEEKPICHRMAAQLLVKNCQGMKDLEVHQYQTVSDQMQRHHVESFAASLAICDMDRAQFDIPERCRPFRYHALESALQGNGQLEVSAQDVSICLHGLGQDHSHWSTWLSYRDTALLLCRGASVDVGKDQAIEFHKTFVRMMEEFTRDLYDDLRHIRKQMADYTQESHAYHEESKAQAERWKVKIHETFGLVAKDLEHAGSTIKSIVSITDNAYQVFRTFVNTMLQTNAAMAANHEKAVELSTNKIKTSFEGIDSLMVKSGEKLVNMGEVVGVMANAIEKLVERQDTIEKASRQSLNAIINATALVQSQGENLNQASLKAAQISEDLDRVAQSTTSLASSGSSFDWFIRGFVIVTTLLGGTFRVVSTIQTNLMLLVIGATLSELIVMLRHREAEIDSESLSSWCFLQDLFKRSPSMEDSLINGNNTDLSSGTSPTYHGRIMRSQLRPSRTTKAKESSESSSNQSN